MTRAIDNSSSDDGTPLRKKVLRVSRKSDGIQSIIDKCENHFDKTGDLSVLKVALDDYSSSRGIVEAFEQEMYSNGYGPPVSAFTPEQIAHLTRVTIDRLHYIIDEYMNGYDKTGNLGFLELASETRVDLQRIMRQVEELRSNGYDIELTK